MDNKTSIQKTGQPVIAGSPPGTGPLLLVTVTVITPNNGVDDDDNTIVLYIIVSCLGCVSFRTRSVTTDKAGNVAATNPDESAETSIGFHRTSHFNHQSVGTPAPIPINILSVTV